MVIINRKEIEEIYTMTEAIEACKNALRMHSEGQAIAPLRMNLKSDNGDHLFMPAYVKETNTTGIKIVSVFPNNKEINKPTVPAQMILMDKKTGEVASIIDGTYLTALRTGAVQGAAIDILANKNSEYGVLIGTGGQAASQLEAMLSVRNLKEVAVIALNETRLNDFVNRMSEKYSGVKIYATKNPDEVIAKADIITTVTSSILPVFNGDLIKKGCHLNAIGSYTSHMKEMPAEAIMKADILACDILEGILVEAGDVIEAINIHGLDNSRFLELGELVSDNSLARKKEEDITFFKSVGTAILDVVVAQEIYEAAIKNNKGIVID